MHYRLQLQRLVVETEQQVLQQHHAQYVVYAAVYQRVSLVQVAVEHLLQLVVGHVHVKRHHVRAVRHYRVYGQVAQHEHALHDVLLHLLHFAVFLALLHYRLDVFLGHLRLGVLNPQQVYHGLRAL